MNSCHDCKHYVILPYTLQGKCDGPEERKVADPVTGERGIEYWPVYMQRRNGFILARVLGTCGKEGRFFEAKP